MFKKKLLNIEKPEIHCFEDFSGFFATVKQSLVSRKECTFLEFFYPTEEGHIILGNSLCIGQRSWLRFKTSGKKYLHLVRNHIKEISTP